LSARRLAMADAVPIALFNLGTPLGPVKSPGLAPDLELCAPRYPALRARVR
jgi:hypothetical protein